MRLGGDGGPDAGGRSARGGLRRAGGAPRQRGTRTWKPSCSSSTTSSSIACWCTTPATVASPRCGSSSPASSTHRASRSPSPMPPGWAATLGAEPQIMLRARSAASPVADRTVEYASEVQGNSARLRARRPGCRPGWGHDPAGRRAPGRAVLSLFQPAEEIDTGARSVLSSGAVDGRALTTIVGFHGQPALPAGEVGASAGPVMACITTLRCGVEGQGGHGAEPHLGRDAVTALAALIVDWQATLAAGRVPATGGAVGRTHRGRDYCQRDPDPSRARRDAAVSEAGARPAAR